jgi:hypothetical protein
VNAINAQMLIQVSGFAFVKGLQLHDSSGFTPDSFFHFLLLAEKYQH